MPKKRKTRRPVGSGSVYRPTYQGPDGSTRQQDVWWIAYRTGGKLIRESSKMTMKREAEALLRERLHALGRGQLTIESRSTTVEDLRDLVLADYRNNGRRSADKIAHTFKHLLAHFGERKAATITAADVEAYKAVRLKVAKPATINRELASLRRGFRLAVRYGRLGTRPDFSLLRENNARRGFFDGDQLAALLPHLPEWLRPLARFLYITGWRRREATRLQWRSIDRRAQVIRIDTTKTDEPRTIPYGTLPALVELIEGQWTRHELLRRTGAMVPFVFDRRGREVKDFRREWGVACAKAGLAGRIPHDFRRSAARNMIRAGIPQHVAMQIGGWKTDNVFRRYAIVDETDLAANLAKLAAQAAT
jgi:integrase